MNRTSRLISACALFTATLMAQRPFGTPPDPATMVQNRIARLTTQLSLTTAQVSQATTIFTTALTATTPLQTTLSTDRQSLLTAVKNNATSVIDQLSSSIGTLNGQILAIQSKADAAFYAILTSDQQTKLDQSGGLSGPRGFGAGPGGPPPGRF